MTRAFSTALQTAKNAAEQSDRWTWLLELTITDPVQGDVVLRFARATSDVTFDGETWEPFPFAVGQQQDDLTGELHEMEVGVRDLSGTVRDFFKSHDPDGARARVILTYWNGATHTAALIERFVVSGIHGTIDTYQLRLGSRDYFMAPFPSRTLDRDRCGFEYRDPDTCQYVQDADGTIRESCDFSLKGPNGCKVHDNQTFFGGFVGLPGRKA